MNHRWNARLHKLPWCPECCAMPSTACTTPSGQVREPHNVRQKIADGLLVVINVEDARAARRLRALRELYAAVEGKALE